MFDNVAKDMALAMYASMVRGIILYHAFHLKLLTTYGAIASSTKVLPRGGQLAQAIALITENDHAAGRPLSTAVVVNSKTKRPGAGFFTQCRTLGYKIGTADEDELDFWYEQLFKLGVQPVTLDGFGERGPVKDLGSIQEVRDAARYWKGTRPRWAATKEKARQADPQPETAPEACSQLPG